MGKSRKEFRKNIEASKRVAQLLTASGKLSGYITMGQIVKAMAGDRDAAQDAVHTMLIYGWAKRRNRNGTMVYGISTKDAVQQRNMEEMELLYKNNVILQKSNHRKAKRIVKLTKPPMSFESVKLWWKVKFTNTSSFFESRLRK